MTETLIIIIPLIIFITGALSVARRNLTHPDDFFLAFKKVGVTAFSSSSIAYAFQISTIYPFLLWGASGFYFIPLINTICWGLGIFLFSLCFKKYKQFIGNDVTIHGFLGNTYGPGVRVIASYLTIIAFLGCAIGETYLGSKVLHSIIENENIFYLIIAVSLILVFGYISYGGQISSIRTDQLQLLTSYVGIFGLLIYLIYLIIKNGIGVSPVLSYSLGFVVLYIGAILYFRKLKFIKFNEQSDGSDKWLNKILNVLIIIMLLTVAIFSFIAFISSHIKSSDITFFNIEGFGYPGLISLIILPLCFQFVDLSNWQRLLSVKHSSNEFENSPNKNIRKGLIVYSIESPFTWLLFVFFGLLTVTSIPHFTFTDLLIDIPKQLINSKIIFENYLGYVFIISVLSIMFSTIDSFIMGMIFTFVYDSYPTTRELLDSKNENELKINYSKITGTGKIFGLISIILGVLLFIVFDKKVNNGGQLFINLLLAFYSAQLAFFPHVVGILFLKIHPSKLWATLSMISGALAGVGLGIYSVIFDPALIWFPVIFCFGLSCSIYAIGFFLKKNENGEKLKANYKKDQFYYNLMISVALFLVASSIYFLSYKNDYHNGVRVWELASYIVTLIYTIWFWYKSPNGTAILLDITKKVPLIGFYIIGPAIFLLAIITSFHLYLIFWGIGTNNFLTNNSVNITLGLIVAVYIIFNLINRQVVKNCSDDAVCKELTTTFKYIDKPTLYVFIILFVYSIYVNLTGHLESMEFFFSGAIAFELLLTSYIWAQTDVVSDEPLKEIN